MINPNIQFRHDMAVDRAGAIDTLTRRNERAGFGEVAAQGGLGLFPRAMMVALLGVLYFGWSHRQEGLVSANDGLGYALGLSGGILMLTMLLYPLRKRLRSMRNWGNMKWWLRIHIFTGFVGPTVILFHCNFQQGDAANSRFALTAMMLVVISGVIGRYLHQRIQVRLVDGAASLQDMQAELGRFRAELVRNESIGWDVATTLQALEDKLLRPQGSWFGRSWSFLTLGFRLRGARATARRWLQRDLRSQADYHGLDKLWITTSLRHGDRLIGSYLKSLRVVAEFRTFTRLFAWWHVVHIPFMVLLVVSAGVHVLAVHMY